jgi:hypothetical protein
MCISEQLDHFTPLLKILPTLRNLLSTSSEQLQNFADIPWGVRRAPEAAAG